MSSLIKNCYSVVSEFAKSSSNIKIVSRFMAEHRYNPLTRHNILILDSSFNPPHKGHISIIENTLRYYNNSNGYTTIVLMLSMKNADKIHPKPELFDKRLRMIDLLSKHLYEANHKNVSVLICLTKFAMFSDKYKAFKEIATKDFGLGNLNIAFLVGFDTLIRVFDAKYYLPGSISNSLQDFILGCQLICLGRSNCITESFASISEQEQYVNDIKLGKISGVPPSWGDKVVVLNPLSVSDDLVQRAMESKSEELQFLTKVSSSEIRNKLKEYYQGKQELQDVKQFLSKRLVPSIVDEILNNKYYVND